MKKPVPKEHEVQAAIVDCLRLAGLTVYETTAYRQKGPSGVDKGIPDLLVVHPLRFCTFIGIEVKRPGEVKWSSREQFEAFKEHHFLLAQSPKDALNGVLITLEEDRHEHGALVKIRSIQRALEAA